MRYGDDYLCGNEIVQIIINGLLIILLCILVFAFVCFLVTLGFYLVYNHKNDGHPWKHAIKRSWPWWIVIFSLPFVVLGIGFYLVK